MNYKLIYPVGCFLSSYPALEQKALRELFPVKVDFFIFDAISRYKSGFEFVRDFSKSNRLKWALITGL